MNLDRKLFARMTIGSNKTDLGFAPIDELMMRATREYVKTKAVSGEYAVIIEMSSNQFTSLNMMTREQQLEHEFNNLHLQTDPNEVMQTLKNGTELTMAMISEAFDDPIFERYRHVCDPKNRVGMDQSVIDAAKFEFDQKYPGWREINMPGWIDS